MECRSFIILVLFAALFHSDSTAEGSGQSAHWTYSGETGPEHWAQLNPGFRACGGKRQSPIHIDSRKTTFNPRFKDFQFENYDKALENTFIVNNGHTAMLTQGSQDFKIRVRGGGFDSTYQFLQLHFHWGSDSRHGSEHLIDGQHFPLEIHMVHYNTKYGNASSAGDKHDGLAVLGSVFRVGAYNKNYEPIINALRDIIHPGDEGTRLTESVTLRSLLPDDTSRYYRYLGSLTTPPCSETVVWTVFSQPVELSEDQFEQFRLLRDEGNEPISNNYRPVQPLNGRTVFSSFNKGSKKDHVQGYKYTISVA